MSNITAGLPAQVTRHNFQKEKWGKQLIDSLNSLDELINNELMILYPPPPQTDVRVARLLPGSAYMSLDGSSAALAHQLQPVLILEPHSKLVHSQLLSCK